MVIHVIPAQAGIQSLALLDSRLRGNDVSRGLTAGYALLFVFEVGLDFFFVAVFGFDWVRLELVGIAR